MKIRLLFLGLTLTTHSWAQTPASNVKDFDELVQKIENNYAGFPDKVTSKNRAAYEALTRSTREQLSTAAEDQVLPLVTAWAAFFKDHHIGIGREVPGAAPPVESRPLVDEAAYRKRWAKGKHHKLEGIWSMDDYRVVIVAREPGIFEGIVLETKAEGWRPGEVKFTIKQVQDQLKFTYRRNNRSVRDGELAILAAGSALDLGGVLFTRSFPALPAGMDLDRLVPQDRFFIKKLSSRTLLIRLPDFDHSNEPRLKALLAEHKKDLDSTENWVIDLRNNGGGDDSTYEPFKAYLYTRPVYTIGMEMRATPDNARKFDEIVADPSYDEETKKYARILAERMRAAQTPFILQGDTSFDIETRPAIAPFPKRVGILIKGAASSGEQFVLWARQSRKVTLFGEPTAGVLDYANLIPFKTPGGLVGAYPTSRSLRLPQEPIDNIGIPPDIKLPASLVDQVSSVQQWLERQAD